MKIESAGIYWDSSSLIKRYIREEGSEIVEGLFKSKKRHFTSVITHAEILTTFHRLKRDGNITASHLENLRREFFIDWKLLAKVDYGQEVQAVASEVIETCTLRGADLVHLATCIELKRKGLNLIFSSFDKRLKNAGMDMGLVIE